RYSSPIYRPQHRANAECLPVRYSLHANLLQAVGTLPAEILHRGEQRFQPPEYHHHKHHRGSHLGYGRHCHEPDLCARVDASRGAHRATGSESRLVGGQKGRVEKASGRVEKATSRRLSSRGSRPFSGTFRGPEALSNRPQKPMVCPTVADHQRRWPTPRLTPRRESRPLRDAAPNPRTPVER